MRFQGLRTSVVISALAEARLAPGAMRPNIVKTAELALLPIANLNQRHPKFIRTREAEPWRHDADHHGGNLVDPDGLSDDRRIFVVTALPHSCARESRLAARQDAHLQGEVAADDGLLTDNRNATEDQQAASDLGWDGALVADVSVLTRKCCEGLEGRALDCRLR